MSEAAKEQRAKALAFRAAARHPVSTIELSTKEIRDCEDGPVEIDSQPWRHGRKVRFAFPLRGSHYAAWIDVHHSEGWQLYGDTVTAAEVQQVERTVKVWEEVK